MKLRILTIILFTAFLILLAGCGPDGPRPVDPMDCGPTGPGECGIVWRIKFEPDPGAAGTMPTVKKQVWVVRESATPGDRWDPVEGFERTLDCHLGEGVERAVTLEAGYVEFQRGGYIVCEDQALAEIIAPWNLEELTTVAGCAFESPCVRTSPLLLNADLNYVAPTEPFPIFSYPQSPSESPDAEWVKLSINGTGVTHEIGWEVEGFIGATPLPIQEEIAVDESSNPPWKLNVKRENSDTMFKYWFNENPPHDGTTFDADTEFEFHPGKLNFYFGDWPGEFSEEATLQLYDLLFDPNDSCAGCN